MGVPTVTAYAILANHRASQLDQVAGDGLERYSVVLTFHLHLCFSLSRHICYYNAGPSASLSMALNHRSTKRHHCKVVGIDLAGSPKRNTGICTLKKDDLTSCTVVHTDQEIIDYVEKEKPALVTIDAPLNLPPGRRSIEDRNGEHFRPCDRELLRRGIPFFPITLGPMRLLTKRGIRLKRVLTRRGYAVIEVYPGAAQDTWRTGRKQDGLSQLRRGLQKLGVKGLNEKMAGDELDAVTAALVGQLFLLGKAEVLGNFKQGAIVVPYPKEMASPS